MKQKGYCQSLGREAEKSVGAVLRAHGRKVSFALRRQGVNAEPFDILVDDKPIEIKVAEPRKLNRSSNEDSFGWSFNIHRHGALEETGLFGYILRLQKFPGSQHALHMFLRAPLDKLTVVVTFSTILKDPRWYQGVQDFYRFAKGEMNE